MEVLIYQGATALTLIPSLAHSHAKFLVSWLIAPRGEGQISHYITLYCSTLGKAWAILVLPLDAPWTDMFFNDTKPETEEVNTTCPAPEAFRRGYASWHMWKEDPKFVPMSIENSSDVNSMIGFRMFVPTLFIYWTHIQKKIDLLVHHAYK